MTSQFYQDLYRQAQAITADEPNLIANLANLSALLFEQLEDVNWAGFYLLDRTVTAHKELILGPFQGRVACLRIPFGKGVCGTAAATRTTQLVHDVHEFPGHIACDAASNAEVVVPLIVNDEVVGVLDIDSPVTGRFDENDAQGLSLFAQVAMQLKW